MKTIAYQKYEEFDALRRQEEALNADKDDLSQLEELERNLDKKGGER